MGTVCSFDAVGKNGMTKGTHRHMIASKAFDWSDVKDLHLRATRGVGFADVVAAIAGYVYLVPIAESDTRIYLKTVIPSRKATRDYLKRHDAKKTPLQDA